MRFRDRRPLCEHDRGRVRLPSGPDLQPERCRLDLPADERIVWFGERGRQRVEHGVDERSHYRCWFGERLSERLELGVNERTNYYRLGCEQRRPVRFRRGRPLREREPRRVLLPSGPDLQGEHCGADLPAVKR